MEIRELNNKEILNKFVGSQKMSQFLQSWEWGEFQTNLGRTIIRLGLFEANSLVGSATLILNTLPLGKSYWYLPRGPIINDQLHPDVYQAAWIFFIKAIVNNSAKTNSLFIKIEPPLEKHQQQIFDEAIIDYNITNEKLIQPSDSWFLSLAKSSDELLNSLHQKTRYNIRLAEKKGVTVRVGSTDEDLDKFWQLCEMTSGRDNFKAHNKDYYKNIFKVLCPSGFIKIYLAEFEGQTLAANLIYYFGDMATYVHGASSNEKRNLMAPHLLQWQQIQDAKQEGYEYYDFWGVTLDESGRHAWTGITRFKKGFGGQGISYLGTYDLALRNYWYKIYKIVKKLKQ